jgi:hypothetical protein
VVLFLLAKQNKKGFFVLFLLLGFSPKEKKGGIIKYHIPACRPNRGASSHTSYYTPVNGM